jgi:hypothetical protein
MRPVLTQLELLDTLHGQHAGLLGKEFDAYRNHTYRLVNFCAAQLAARDDEAQQKIQIAAAFHDLGIWSAHTFDYLPPSNALAQAWLSANGKQAWSDDIAGMINARTAARSLRRFSRCGLPRRTAQAFLQAPVDAST